MYKQTVLVSFAIVSLALACGTDFTASDETESKALQTAENPGDIPQTEGNAEIPTGNPDSLACDCPEGQECMRLEGKRMSEAGLCEEATQLVTCYEYATECFDVYQYSRDPSGNLWIFPSTCIPSGWQRDGNEGPVDISCVGTWKSAYCPSLNEHECANQIGCGAMNAKRACESEECAADEEFVACVESVVRACHLTETLARDPSGELWCFSDACIPPGWTNANDGGLDVTEMCR